MNPMSIMRLKPLFEKFRNNHPKVPLFFAAASQSVGEGSVIEIKVTAPDGKNLVTNMKVTSDDLVLIAELRETFKK